jgi:hypothetical protein
MDNAAWCMAMWRAHGLPVRRGPGLVACEGAPPSFYPNAVTIDPGADAAAQVEWLAKALQGAASVKDSFRALDLATNGFTVLFEATWLRRPGGAPADGGDPDLEWRLVETADELAAWERGWRGGPAEGRIFLPALLQDRGVGIVAGWRGAEVEAGGVLTPTGATVGLSNVFGDYAGAVAVAATMFPQADLVGYEHGEDLETALTNGFKAVGALRIWARAG